MLICLPVYLWTWRGEQEMEHKGLIDTFLHPRSGFAIFGRARVRQV